jgi:hypothetical protein
MTLKTDIQYLLVFNQSFYIDNKEHNVIDNSNSFQYFEFG